jgi:hypothetical protein
MAVSNITGFSVGQDLQSVLLIPVVNGLTLAPIPDTALGRLLDFHATPVISELSMTPVNNGGVQLVRNVYHGWNGDLSFGRYNGFLTGLMAGVMGIFNQVGDETYFNIVATVVNTANGNSVSSYIFNNCVISQVSTGDFGGTKEVTQKLMFRGGQMLVNGAAAPGIPPGSP